MAPTRTVETRFWTFNQNNSGGSFIENEGISHYVIVEATSRDHADQRAEAIGIYFNGCEDGQDCSCCGDRWYPAYGKGDAEPKVYDTPAEEYLDMFCDKPVVIHYLDGTTKVCGKRGTWAEQQAADAERRAREKETN